MTHFNVKLFWHIGWYRWWFKVNCNGSCNVRFKRKTGLVFWGKLHVRLPKGLILVASVFWSPNGPVLSKSWSWPKSWTVIGPLSWSTTTTYYCLLTKIPSKSSMKKKTPRLGTMERWAITPSPPLVFVTTTAGTFVSNN